MGSGSGSSSEDSEVMKAMENAAGTPSWLPFERLFRISFDPSYGIVTRTGSRREGGESLDNSAQRHSYLRTSSFAD